MKVWTPAEDFIIQNGKKLTIKQLMALMPDRSADSITHRYRKIHRTRPVAGPWTENEDEMLRDLHAEGVGYAEMAAKIGRTYAAVKGRLRFLSKDKIVAAATPPKADPWPDLGPNAFRDVKVSADPAVQLSKPQDRTLAGVGTRALVA